MGMARKQNGFTLAEVLITLGVIGVVAAMTIPPLMNKTNDAELRSSFKKIYSELAQTTAKLANENGGDLVGLFTSSNVLRDYYKTSLSFSKECDATQSPGICWHATANYKSFSGDTPEIWGDVYSGLILNNGALLLFVNNGSVNYVNCTATCGSTLRCGFFLVDVNGFKNPNVIGRDIFVINILKDKLLPSGSGPSGSCDYDNCGSTVVTGASAKYAGCGCGEWVIENKDY